MSHRIGIAIEVWLVGILFAGAATVLMFAAIMFFSLSHAYGGGPLPWINDALWPFLAGAVGPIGGALLGTLVNIKMHPFAVGAACATPVLMLIASLVR